MYQIPLIILLIFSYPIYDIKPSPLNAPAVLVVYDPALGDINCDGDCTTVASGPLEQWMYGAAGACDDSLLGATIYFPAIDFSMKCVDKGSGIKVTWSKYYQQYVLYFDAMWHLEMDGQKITGAPDWNYSLLDEWHVAWD